MRYFIIRKNKLRGGSSVIDLHCHTSISDGSVSVDELLFIAKRMGIKNLAITDHDTFASAKRGMILGPRYGINVIFGAEFSSFISDLNLEVHILCYMCDFPDRLEGICLKNSTVRKEAHLALIDQIVKYYPISLETVSSKARGSSCIFKSHIIRSIMDTGFVVPLYSVAYEKLFGENSKINKVQPKYLDPSEIISQIHQAGGISILAHPDEYIVNKALPLLMSFGLDGVEAYHPCVKTTLKDRILEISKKYDLLITGGSDFHGINSSRQRYLGMCSTPDNCFEQLRQRKMKSFKTA